MSYTVSLQQRLQQLKKAQADMEHVLYRAAEGATQRAVEAAMDATPPKKGTGRGPYIGTNTITGELKARWEWDSTMEPMGFAGGQYVTVLRNNAEYASYVNDGHRMDRHFVPGLYVNPSSGMLEINPDGTGGLVVGTQTSYVPGLHIEEAAQEEYHRVVQSEAEKLRRLLE